MQYEMDIKNLKKELDQTKDDERKKTDEMAKYMVSLHFFSRKISNLYAIKKEVFKGCPHRAAAAAANTSQW